MLQADPEQRFTTFIKALQATRLDREITDYNSKRSHWGGIIFKLYFLLSLKQIYQMPEKEAKNGPLLFNKKTSLVAQSNSRTHLAILAFSYIISHLTSYTL